MTEIAVERRAGSEASSDATILVAGVRLREIDMWRGLVIVLMVVGVNLLGDGLRDRPRRKKKGA